MSEKPEFLRLPFIVGVTGHRALLDTDAATAITTVRKVLELCAANLPHTPIWVFSALAEGADQLVAKVVISLQTTPGYEGRFILKPVLPMSREEYIQSQQFSSQGRTGFEECLKAASSDDIIELMYSPAGIERGTDTWKEAQYANQGAFLARQSHILIALWNGQDNRKVGGTGQVVRQMLEGWMNWGDKISPNPEFPCRMQSMGGENGLVLHVPIDNQNEPNHKSITFDSQPHGKTDDWWRCKGTHIYFCWPSEPLLSEEVEFRHREFLFLLENIERFNKGVQRSENRDAAGFNKRCDNAYLGGVAIGSLAQEAQFAAHLFQQADTIALNRQRWEKSVTAVMFVTTAAFLFSTDMVENMSGKDLSFGFNFWVIAMSLSVVIGFLLSHRVGLIKRAFLDSRVLAESMRVACFLIHARLQDMMQEHPPSIGSRSHAWLTQLRDMVKIPIFVQRTSHELEKENERIIEIREWWIKDQRSYFKGKRDRLYSLLIRLNRLAWLSYLLGVLTLFALVFDCYMDEAKHKETLSLAMKELMFIGISISAWKKLAGYEEDLARYGASYELFARAEKKIEICFNSEHGNPKAAKDIVTSLARDALEENCNWYDTHISKNYGPLG